MPHKAGGEASKGAGTVSSSFSFSSTSSINSTPSLSDVLLDVLLESCCSETSSDGEGDGEVAEPEDISGTILPSSEKSAVVVVVQVT